MSPVANLIARAVGHSLREGGRAIVLALAREAQRQSRGRLHEPSGPRAVEVIQQGPLAQGVFVAWMGGLVAFALVLLNAHLLLPEGRAVGVFQIVVGAILLVEGLGLAVERFPFRRLLAARLVARSRRHAGRTRVRWLRLVGAALTVVAIVWVATGAYATLRGAVALL